MATKPGREGSPFTKMSATPLPYPPLSLTCLCSCGGEPAASYHQVLASLDAGIAAGNTLHTIDSINTSAVLVNPQHTMYYYSMYMFLNER